MSSGQGIYRYSDFRGGEAAVFPITKFNPKYSVMLKNLCISERGGVSVVPGYQALNQSSCGDIITNGVVFQKADGSEQIIVSSAGRIYLLGEYVYTVGLDAVMVFDAVEDFDGIGLGEIRGGQNELALIHSGLDSSAKIYFSQMHDKLIISNGVDFPLKWDGSVMARLGSVFYPDFESIKDFDVIDDFDALHAQYDIPRTFWKTHVHASRLWALDKADRMMVYHSALKDIDDFQSENNAGYLDMKFVLKQGDKLQDITTYIDVLILFFASHIAIYAGTNPTADGNFQLTQLIDSVGAIAPDTVQSLGTDLTFLSASGVKTLRQVITTGSLNVEGMSSPIDPAFVPMLSHYSKVSSSHFPTKSWYILSVDDAIWVYSYAWKAWSRISGADCNAIFGSPDGRVFFGGNGYLYEYGVSKSFAGKDIEWEWDTAWLLMGKGLKVYPKVLNVLSYPLSETATVRIRLVYDYQEAAAPEHYLSFTTQSNLPVNQEDFDAITDFNAIANFDNMAELSQPRYADIRLPMFGSGRAMQMRVTGNKPVEINDILIQYTAGRI